VGEGILKQTAKKGVAATDDAVSRGAQLRQQLGKQFGEYKHFREQGFTATESKYLMQPYDNARRMGHHFPVSRALAKEWGMPRSLRDSAFNVLKPRNMSLGRFYELHFKVDPHFAGTSLGRGMQPWSGARIGLQKLEGFSRLWHATPGPLKAAGASSVAGTGAAGGALWWLLNNDE
jgi:hypothetical protein